MMVPNFELMNFVKVFFTCKKVTKTMGEDQKDRQANCMRRIYSALVRVDLSHAFPIFFHAIVRSFRIPPHRVIDTR